MSKGEVTLKARAELMEWEFDSDSDPVWAYEKDGIDVVLDQVFSDADERSPLRIIEICSCLGHLAIAIAERFPNAEVVGLDEPDFATRVANESKSQENLTFIRSGIEEIPYPDEYFDFAVCRYWLHHFPEPHRNLAEIRRILRKGGRFGLIEITPDEGMMQEHLNRIYTKIEGNLSGFERVYTVEEIERLQEAAGLKVSKVVRFIYRKELLLAGFPDEFKKAPAELLEKMNVSIAEDAVHLDLPASVVLSERE